MENRTTLERVQEILRDDLGYREECLSPDARFIDDIGMDSLDMVEFTMEVDEEFGIVIEDIEWDEILTIGAAVTLIDKKMASRENS